MARFPAEPKSDKVDGFDEMADCISDFMASSSEKLANATTISG